MIIDWIIVSLALIALSIGSISDLKKREIADWISYALMFSGVGLNAIKSVQTGDYWFVVFSLIGLGTMYAISLIMFYTGQWGGGDAKVLMGLGAYFGAYTPLFATDFHSSILPEVLTQFGQYNPLFLGVLILNIAIAGAFYGLLWTFALSIIHFKKTVAEYIEQANKQKKIRYIAYSIALLCLLLGVVLQSTITKMSLFFIGLLIALMVTAHTYVKTIENVAMIRTVPVSSITEGEWIVDEVFDKKKKYICGPKDLGITNEQIEKLKKNDITKITIKVGIPFIPAFLIGFILTIIFGNIVVTIFTAIL